MPPPCRCRMDLLRRTLRNVLAQPGSQAVTWVATLVFTALLGRYLGSAGFGVLFLALSFAASFGVLVDFGLQPLITREVARHPEHLTRYLLHGAAIKGSLWGLSFIAIQAADAALGYPAETRRVLLIFGVTMGFTSGASLVTAVFRAQERLVPPSLGTIVERVFTLLVGGALLLAGAGAMAMAWVMLLAGIPICAGLIVLARPILSFIYGRDEFLAAAPALQILGVGVLVLYINSAVGWALVALDLERRLPLIPLAGLVLNLVMIPRWQAGGTAATTVISEIVVGAAFVVMLPKWLLTAQSLSVAARATLAALGMSAALLLVRDAPLALSVPLGIAVYAVLALLLRAVQREDLAMLRNAAVRRRAPPPVEPAERLEPA